MRTMTTLNAYTDRLMIIYSAITTTNRFPIGRFFV